MKSLAIAVASLCLANAPAQATLVDFSQFWTLGWADGTFSTTPVGSEIGFFYPTAIGTGAINAFGANDLRITFDNAVTLDRLNLGLCDECPDNGPTRFTATLYDGADQIVGQQTIAASFTPTTLYSAPRASIR